MSGNTYLTGDIHSDIIGRFCRKSNPYFPFENGDTVIQLGDWGVRWSFDDSPGGRDNKVWKSDTYKLDWLKENTNATYLICTGNHDNYDWMESLPKYEFYEDLGETQYIARVDLEYPKVRYIIEPEYLTIKGRHFLFLPGADSHDIQDGILDPYAPDYRQRKHDMKRNGKYYFRTAHLDWWQQEKIDEEAIITMAQRILDYMDEDSYPEYVISHDMPAWWVSLGTYGTRFKETDGEVCLERVRQMLCPKHWCGGHFHVESDIYDSRLDSSVHCLYHRIVDIEELEKGEDIYGNRYQ